MRVLLETFAKAEWTGSAGRGARAGGMTSLPGSREARQRRGEFLRGAVRVAPAPRAFGPRCPRRGQTQDLRRGEGCKGERAVRGMWVGLAPRAAPARHLLIFACHPPGRSAPRRWPWWGRGALSNNSCPCPVGQVQRGGHPPTLSSVPCWHRWPRPPEEAAEALSLPGALPGNRRARGSDWRRSERGRGRGASCEGEGEEAWRVRPAHPHFLSEQGELGPHLTHPALGGKAGALGVAGQERVKGPEGASGVGSTLGCGFPPARKPRLGNAAAAASFLQTQRSSSWRGRPSRARGRGTEGLVGPGLLRASKARCSASWD